MKKSMWVGSTQLKPVAAAYDGTNFYVSSIDENIKKTLMSFFENAKKLDIAKNKDFDIVNEVCSKLTYSTGDSYDWNKSNWESTDKVINMFENSKKKTK